MSSSSSVAALLLAACAAGRDSASDLLGNAPAPLAVQCLLAPGPAGAIASIRVDSTGVVWILDNTGEVMRYERAQGDCLLHGTLATIGDGLAPVTDLEVDAFRYVYADLGNTELHRFTSDGVEFGVCEHRAASSIAPDPYGGTVYTWDAGGTHVTRVDVGDPDCPTDGMELDVDKGDVGIANGDELALAARDSFDMAPPGHLFGVDGRMGGDLGAATEEFREADTLSDLAATTTGYLMLEPAGDLFVLDLDGVTTRILTPTELFGAEARIVSVGAIGDSTIWLATDEDSVWALED